MMKMREKIPDAAVHKLLKAWDRNIRNIKLSERKTGPRRDCRSSIAALLKKYRMYADCDLL